MKASTNVALFVRGNMLSFSMLGTLICMLGTGSQLSNYWQNVLNTVFEIPTERVSAALEMPLLQS